MQLNGVAKGSMNTPVTCRAQLYMDETVVCDRISNKHQRTGQQGGQVVDYVVSRNIYIFEYLLRGIIVSYKSILKLSSSITVNLQFVLVRINVFKRMHIGDMYPTMHPDMRNLD